MTSSQCAPSPFASGQRAYSEALRIFANNRPIPSGNSYPVPVHTESGLVLLVMFFPVAFEPGPPPYYLPRLPNYAVHLDPITARVLRLWACTADELGIIEPAASIPEPESLASPERYAAKRERFLSLCSGLWQAFASSQMEGPGLQEAAREYYRLLRQLEGPIVVPYYVAAASDFFRWLFALLPSVPAK